MTFRRRFIALFLAVSCVPLVLVQVFTFLFYVPSVSSKIQELLAYSLHQKGENVRLLFNGEVQLIYQLAGDPQITDLVRSLSDDSVPKALQKSQLVDAFSRLSLFDANLAGIGYVSESGLLVEYDKYLMVRSAADFEQFFSLQRMREQVDRYGGLQFFPTTTFRDRAGLVKNLFLVAFPFIDTGLRIKSGYLFLLVLEAPFREVLNPRKVDSSGILTRTVLVDQAGAPISVPQDTLFGNLRVAAPFDNQSFLAQSRLLKEFAGKPVNVTTAEGPYPGWTLATYYDESSVFSDRYWIALYTLATGLFLLALSGAGSFLVYRSLFRSVSRLLASVSGEDSRLGMAPVRGANEFEVLGTAWDSMRRRLSSLVTEVNARNASLLDASEGRRLAEIRALEAQVNPHFLYNTLNTLNWMAIEHHQPELSQGLSDLAVILRYSISQIDVIASLGEEREWLEKYLSLQGLRFRGNLESQITSAPDQESFRLYKMLFQPFVENALVHGLDPNKAGGLLEVSFSVSQDRWLTATIEDNGRGFDPESFKNHPRRSPIGIANVEERLKSYYRGRARLTVKSSPGQGTRVELVVPEVEL